MGVTGAARQVSMGLIWPLRKPQRLLSKSWHDNNLLPIEFLCAHELIRVCSSFLQWEQQPLKVNVWMRLELLTVVLTWVKFFTLIHPTRPFFPALPYTHWIYTPTWLHTQVRSWLIMPNWTSNWNFIQVTMKFVDINGVNKMVFAAFSHTHSMCGAIP